MGTVEKRVLVEVRVLTREQMIQKCLAGQMKWKQAAMVLGLSSRQMRRLRCRYQEAGAAGLRDGRSGNRRKRRIADSMLEQVKKLKRTKYEDYSVKHFYDVMQEKHGL